LFRPFNKQEAVGFISDDRILYVLINRNNTYYHIGITGLGALMFPIFDIENYNGRLVFKLRNVDINELKEHMFIRRINDIVYINQLLTNIIDADYTDTLMNEKFVLKGGRRRRRQTRKTTRH
jgi:hypothetical protein